MRKILLPGTSRQAFRLAVTVMSFMLAFLYLIGAAGKYLPGHQFVELALVAGGLVIFAVAAWYLVLFGVYSAKEHAASTELAANAAQQPGIGDYRALDYTPLGINRNLMPGGVYIAVGLVLAFVVLMIVAVTLDGQLAYEPYTTSWYVLGWGLPGGLFLLAALCLWKGAYGAVVSRKTRPDEKKYRQFTDENGFWYEASPDPNTAALYNISSSRLPDYVRQVTRLTKGQYMSRSFEFVGLFAAWRRGRNNVPYYGLLRRESPGATAAQVRGAVQSLSLNLEILDIEVSGNTVTVIVWPYLPIDRAGVMELFRCMDAIDAAAGAQ